MIAVQVVEVRAADVAIAIVAVVVPVARVVPVAAPVVIAARVVRVVRATRWAQVVLEDQVAPVAIAARVVRVPIVARVVLVVPAVRRTDSRPAAPAAAASMRAGKMRPRSSRASVPTVNRCRRAASARVSQSAPTQMAWVPMESRGIPSVVQSARPSAQPRVAR